MYIFSLLIHLLALFYNLHTVKLTFPFSGSLSWVLGHAQICVTTTIIRILIGVALPSPEAPSHCPLLYSDPSPPTGNLWCVLWYDRSIYWRKSHEWNQTVCNFFRQAYFTQNNAFQIHPDCPIYQQFSPFHGRAVLHWKDVPVAIHSGYSDDEFVSWACYNKVPQTRGLKATQIYSLVVLEERNLKSKCQQHHAPFEGPRGRYFLASSGFRW